MLAAACGHSTPSDGMASLCIDPQIRVTAEPDTVRGIRVTSEPDTVRGIRVTVGKRFELTLTKACVGRCCIAIDTC